MRTSAAILISLGFAAINPGTANAQPGDDGDDGDDATPQPAYAAPPVQPQLTLEEQALLDRGYITPGQHITGAVTALSLGWGLGQVIQGRWQDRGWIFTLGDSAALVAVIYGGIRLGHCAGETGCNETPAVEWIAGGVLALIGFRVWETVDAAVVPSAHNRRLTALRQRLGMPIPIYAVPFVVSTVDRGGLVGGLALSF